MAHGIIVALIVSAVWIVLQNLFMHVRPAENRFGAMATGYLLSLPAVYAGYRWMPDFGIAAAVTAGNESYWMGLFQAYLLHLLMFFQYVHFFYHVERSVTLRFFVELLSHGEPGAPLPAIQKQYSLEEMIEQRLEVMRAGGFVILRAKTWRLSGKGKLLAFTAIVGSWLFQFKGQHERL
jgi:hypothetical protein